MDGGREGQGREGGKVKQGREGRREKAKGRKAEGGRERERKSREGGKAKGRREGRPREGGREGGRLRGGGGEGRGREGGREGRKGGREGGINPQGNHMTLPHPQGITESHDFVTAPMEHILLVSLFFLLVLIKLSAFKQCSQWEKILVCSNGPSIKKKPFL